jgi:hypothetical protein
MTAVFVKSDLGIWMCLQDELDAIPAPDKDLASKFLVLYGLEFEEDLFHSVSGDLRAVYSGSEQELIDLLDLGAHQTKVEKDKVQAYSLIANAYSGRMYVVNKGDPTATQILELVEDGMLSCTDLFTGGQTVLTICCSKARANRGEEGARVARALIELAGELTAEEKQTTNSVQNAEAQKRLNFINHVTREGHSALHRAVHTTNYAIAKVLVEAGADIGLQSTSDSHTPYTFSFLYSKGEASIAQTKEDGANAFLEVCNLLEPRFAKWDAVEATIKKFAPSSNGGAAVEQLVAALTSEAGWSMNRALDSLQLNNLLGPLRGMSREFELQLASKIMIVVEELCLPLLALAGDKKLVDQGGNKEEVDLNDGLNLKAFCRDVLGAGVLTIETPPGWKWRDGENTTMQQRVLQVVQEGMSKLEAELLSFYEAAKPELAVLPEISLAEQLVGEAITWASPTDGSSVGGGALLMHQLCAHGRIRWLEELDGQGAIRALLNAGMDMRDILLSASCLPSLFGAADPIVYRGFWTSVYVWWLRAVAARCDVVLQPWIKSVLQDVVDSADGAGGGLSHHSAPLKTSARVMDKKGDYRQDTIALMKANDTRRPLWAQRVGRVRDEALAQKSGQKVWAEGQAVNGLQERCLLTKASTGDWLVRSIRKAGYWTERGAQHKPILGHMLEAGGMGDFCRCSISCDTPRQLRSVFEKLVAMRLSKGDVGEVVRVKNGFHKDAMSSGGYRDIKLNILVDVPLPGGGSVNHIAEVQLLLEHYVEVKAHMHLLYKVLRGDFF